MIDTLGGMNPRSRPQAPPLPPPPKTNPKLIAALVAAGILIVVLLAVAGYFIWQSLQNNPSGAADQAAIKRVTSQVSRIYLVPAGEEPVVARIQDKSKLTGQAFYKDAQNNDYILVYKNAKIALLYRENDHKLVNVAPISQAAASKNPTN